VARLPWIRRRAWEFGLVARVKKEAFPNIYLVGISSFGVSGTEYFTWGLNSLYCRKCWEILRRCRRAVVLACDTREKNKKNDNFLHRTDDRTKETEPPVYTIYFLVPWAWFTRQTLDESLFPSAHLWIAWCLDSQNFTRKLYDHII